MAAEKRQAHGGADQQEGLRDAGGGQPDITTQAPGGGQEGQAQDLPGAFFPAGDGQAAIVVDDRGGQHQGQESDVPTAVEEIAARQQQQQPPSCRQEPV